MLRKLLWFGSDNGSLQSFCRRKCYIFTNVNWEIKIYSILRLFAMRLSKMEDFKVYNLIKKIFIKSLEIFILTLIHGIILQN